MRRKKNRNNSEREKTYNKEKPKKSKRGYRKFKNRRRVQKNNQKYTRRSWENRPGSNVDKY